ncbi:myozenin-3 isoform X2 [Acinonyx jubatus]|uniref:Myozenin-3 isoform X2 n=1 Tax=Acinonyx jubatus TaxID=32536 RepID=A0ABM3N9L7_ACIJB|nr:myozenin-3 isoform X2 [Acinonyx jubatus]
MIPKEQKGSVMAAMGDLTGPVPLLDLGKKLSVPQDLMMEELSLRNNRGSLLFQKRQRRVQRFTFEFPASQRALVDRSAKGKVTGTAGTAEAGPLHAQGKVANGPEGQSCSSELHIFRATPGGPEVAQPSAFPAERPRSPSALAPGYAQPLKGVPPEKFNHTAIPKGYRCPWQEFISYRDYQSDGRSHTPSPAEFRNFNKVGMCLNVFYFASEETHSGTPTTCPQS